MALTRPILLGVAAFDAENAQDFIFSVVGGDQTVASQLTIINQSTNVIVYQHTYSTYGTTLTLPANTLDNNTYYSAYVITYNANGDASLASTAIQFWCYTTPIFVFSNIPVTGIIPNSSFSFEITYDQIEGELLESYKFDLFDVQGTLLSTSGTKYVNDTTAPPNTFSFVFGGFSDGTSYKIQASGITEQGTILSTSLISFTVNYVSPSTFALVELHNNCSGGYITISPHIVQVIGTSYPAPPIYINDDTEVDARGTGAYVDWNGDFKITNDFTAQLWGYDFNENETVIKFSNVGGDSAVVSYRIDENDNTKVYIDCLVTSNNVPTYYCYSDSISIPDPNEEVQFWIRRINNIYEIAIYNLG